MELDHNSVVALIEANIGDSEFRIESKSDKRFLRMADEFNKIKYELSAIKDEAAHRLYAVHPHTSQTTEELDKAHAECLIVLKNIFKEAIGGRGAPYASLEHVTESVNPILGKHGLSVKQLDVYNEYADPVLITRLSHNSGQWYESRSRLIQETTGGLAQNQLFGASMTYRRRYDLLAILWISATGDPDIDQ